MTSITPASVDLWVGELKREYAPATVARLIKFCKQFYHAAKRAKIAVESPFAEVKAGSMANPARIRFVTREEIQRVLDACPNNQWRLLIALARYGGLRCPSEIVGLTWNDIDWDQCCFLVRASKTAHHADGGRRMVPLFPELRPFLEAGREHAESGNDPVIRFVANNETNLRTGFRRIIKRAGLKPWTRLFQNLRASRESELAKHSSLHEATTWIGNSVAVAAKHYLSVTSEDFSRAARQWTGTDVKAVQNAVQSPADGSRHVTTVVPSTIENALKVGECQDVSASDCTNDYTPQESNL